MSAKPSAKENKIEKLDFNHYKIFVKEPPINGRANAVIIELLADYFSVSKLNVKIVKGAFTREKIIDILISVLIKKKEGAMETSVEDILAGFKNGEIGIFKILFSAKVEQEIRSLWEWGIDRISDENIRQAVKYYYLYKVPGQFFTAPSSTSGKHPYWHNVSGGLVRHIAECCVSADRLLAVFGFVEDDDRTIHAPARDIVLAATVITDTQKNGIPWGDTSVRNHGEIAANVWRDVAESCKLSLDTTCLLYTSPSPRD